MKAIRPEQKAANQQQNNPWNIKSPGDNKQQNTKGYGANAVN
jgi:hypothetical protein